METKTETPEVIAAREKVEQARRDFDVATALARKAEAEAREAQRQAEAAARKATDDAILAERTRLLVNMTAPAVDASYDTPVYSVTGSWGSDAQVCIDSKTKGRLVTISLDGKRVEAICHVGASYDTETHRFPRRKDGGFNWEKVNATAIAGVRNRMSALAAKDNRSAMETAFLARAEATLSELAAAFPELDSRISDQHSAPGGKHYSAQRCRAVLHNDRFTIVLTMVGTGNEDSVNVEVNGNMGYGDGLLSALVKMTAQMIDGSE